MSCGIYHETEEDGGHIINLVSLLSFNYPRNAFLKVECNTAVMPIYIATAIQHTQHETQTMSKALKNIIG